MQKTEIIPRFNPIFKANRILHVNRFKLLWFPIFIYTIYGFGQHMDAQATVSPLVANITC